MAQIQRSEAALQLVEWYWESDLYNKPVDFCGVTLRNPVGFAAGLDKNAVAVLFLQSCGFGFGSVGTALRYFQLGNPRPRVFRLMSEEAIINRLGFNHKGSWVVQRNLRRDEPRIKIPLMGSLGKMAYTPDTPAERVHEDYIGALWDMPASVVKFIVINVSSPNTAGLRDLQHKRAVEALVRAVVAEEVKIAQLGERQPRPVLVKIAPDLIPSEIDGTLEGLIAGGASGLVGTNTTVTRPFGIVPPKYADQKGGLSGSPVFELMMRVMRHVHKQAPNLPLMLVGGINSTERAKQALEIGTAIKINTPFIFHGPRLVPELKSAA